MFTTFAQTVNISKGISLLLHWGMPWLSRECLDSQGICLDTCPQHSTLKCTRSEEIKAFIKAFIKATIQNKW